MCEDLQPPPEGSTITQALEVSYRSVWVSLVTRGVGELYQQAITQFVVSCATAYKAGYSLTALKFELMANEGTKPVGGVDMRLNEREKETRQLWMALVYMTLSKFQFESVNPPPPVHTELRDTKLATFLPMLRTLVDHVSAAAKRGYSLETYKMELSLSDPIPEDGDQQKANAQKNLRSQWSRIIFTTINMLPDSKKGFSTSTS